ncbi:hypothetical protein EG68_01655 [Paragonimus skrjabini miyazakii]|uniref:Cyclic nucleotide-binding domain-containing protein n=1 Tax=Paragonimus skrjabini miyazakii TaxID=59628 RepID=A0A8S9Z398_9TREM|nr:hypothetical protein EG68_01655 [Paragonimus skrjabini miyazakii]
MQTDVIARSENHKETLPSNKEIEPRRNGRCNSLRNIIQVISIPGEPSSPPKKTWKKRRLPPILSTGQSAQTIHVLDTMTNIDDKVALDFPDTELNAESQNAKSAIFAGTSVIEVEDDKAVRPKLTGQHVKHKYKTKLKASFFQPPMPLELIEAQKKIHSKGRCANPCWFHAQGKRLLMWLTVLSVTGLYNLWFVIARQAFTDLQDRYTRWWITMDLCADTIYLVDIIVQVGTTYLEHGLHVLDRRKLAMRYIYTKYFVLDLVTLVPLDLIQFHVGQVGNIINARNAARVEFEEILDGVKSYMRMHTVDDALRKRILRWCDYAWQKRKGSGMRDINALEILPDRLKTELALDVNLDTLKRVRIFRECEPEFLHDLVLKMRPRIFTPNDYICRKDEIARELFIIADGVLEVVGRTADVRAVGYADLFVLSRQDVLDALRDHPDAEVHMMMSAKNRLHGDKQASKQPSSSSVNNEQVDIPGQSLASLENVIDPKARETSLKLRFQNIAQEDHDNLSTE